ncbi:universal stress protein [Sphingobium lignivorans]|uniref:Nucleotide-binding universal stress UspA family protein n=1 Tax=Sphingobium lignivorans TaxID=2735886 RepID=A0ABR6NGP2_9SPHN|nr:universal stress protein [Sphingobium lignivorans]MBB5986448.1 nucleotide-binding universal stress UspA family protein [Sphingobium lignivorans]
MNIDGPVLVATDLSARSDRAIDRALSLGAAWGKPVEVIHVVDPGEARQDHDALEAAVRAVLPDPAADVRILLPEGSAPAKIAEAGQGAALIVTGVARTHSLGDYFLGTAVDYVVRHADTPVLVVKQRPHAPYARLLIASDLSDCSRAALITAVRLFPAAHVRLVHAYHVPYEAWLDSEEGHTQLLCEVERDVAQFLSHPDISTALRGRIEIDLRFGSTDGAIRRSLAEDRPDLVVLGTHGKSALAHAVIGRTAEALLSWVPVDTLMVRATR